MKTQFTLVFMLFFSANIFAQIEWAEEGTRWWLHITNYFDYSMTSQYEAVGQENIGGKDCQVVNVGSFNFYTYEENGQVFLWDPNTETFNLRYDWNKQVGETYDCSVDTFNLTCEVTQIEEVDINGTNHKRQSVTITDDDDPDHLIGLEYVISGIGSLEGFPITVPNGITVELWAGLACFDTETTGLYSTEQFPEVSCFGLANPVWEVGGQQFEMAISPNPASKNATLRYSLPPHSAAAQVRIANALGQQHALIFLENTQGEIPLTDLPAGLHFISLIIEGKIIGTEILMAND